MDMAVANLLKHKIRFEFLRKGDEQYEPQTYERYRRYVSSELRDIEKVDVTIFKPFVYYLLSKVLHEDWDIIIDVVTVTLSVFILGEDENRVLMRYRFENPREGYPELFFTQSVVQTRPFPEQLINQPFSIDVDVSCYYISNWLREYLNRREFNSDDESQDEDEYTPPDETYRQEKCVICLEAPPSILYLDCMHIVVCDSCERVKSNTPLQFTCDVCRARISKRIKL